MLNLLPGRGIRHPRKLGRPDLYTVSNSSTSTDGVTCVTELGVVLGTTTSFLVLDLFLLTTFMEHFSSITFLTSSLLFTFLISLLSEILLSSIRVEFHLLLAISTTFLPSWLHLSSLFSKFSPFSLHLFNLFSSLSISITFLPSWLHFSSLFSKTSSNLLHLFNFTSASIS